jgi:hypothetical protein
MRQDLFLYLAGLFTGSMLTSIVYIVMESGTK